MKLEDEITQTRQTVEAFLSDIENPHRIDRAIKDREREIDRLAREIDALENSRKRLPELYRAAADKLERLTKQKAIEDNKALQELLRLQKRVEEQLRDHR